MVNHEMKGGNVCDTYNNLHSEAFRQDANGYLIGRAVVTTIGVFPYLLEDGSIFNELRLPEEVFSRESLDSLRLIPITNDHPASMVDIDNIKELQVGTTGEDVCRFDLVDGEVWGVYKTDGSEVSIPLKITDKDAVDAVLGGKRALSCGYYRDLELSEGTWCGIHYDGIQRNIRYNHVAIVDRGRAGDAAVIRMDNAFVPTFMERADSAGESNHKEEASNMAKKELILDSAPYEVEEAVADAYDAVVADRDAVKAERDGLQGQLDAANAQIASLQNEMKGMVKADEVNSLVKELRSVRDVADKFGVALDDNMSVIDMKKAVIKVVNPTVADSIDNQSEDYINGAFQFCVTAKQDAPETPAPKQDGADEPKDDETTAYDVLDKRLSSKYGRK